MLYSSIAERVVTAEPGASSLPGPATGEVFLVCRLSTESVSASIRIAGWELFSAPQAWTPLDDGSLSGTSI